MLVDPLIKQMLDFRQSTGVATSKIRYLKVVFMLGRAPRSTPALYSLLKKITTGSQTNKIHIRPDQTNLCKNYFFILITCLVSGL
jgi:hypothetical protein